MTFIAIQMFDKLKLSLVFRIACAVSILGGWIRVIEVSETFTSILIGYCVISLSFPILLTSITLVCNTWLADSERAYWIQILGLTVPIGSILSFAIAGVVFAGEDAKYVDCTKKLMWIQNILLSVFCGGLGIFVRSKPELPSSSISEHPEPRR